MWLLDTKSLALEAVDEPSSVKYAILSHTWEEDEVTFSDISDLDRARQKAGFSKIAKTCELARERGLQYAWVDTCCIDKSSSAELSEAINSMFAWYKSSTVCFVFLSDLPPLENPENPFDRQPGLPYSQEAVGGCRWFTRGWTLQEPIAPARVEFYNSNWEMFTQKSECTWVLSCITSVAVSVLDSPSNLRQTPVAVKMSWAASRKTKRIEDRAYSLLGIFDIHMPLLYGERYKSFRRFQEEIARESDDLSLFAWRSQSSDRTHDENFQLFRGIFARSPTEFRGCSQMRKTTFQSSKPEFSLFNRGVMIKDSFQKSTKDVYVMDLGFSKPYLPIRIFLVHTANGFVRSIPWSLDALVENDRMYRVLLGDVLSICVLRDVTQQEDFELQRLRHKSFHVDFDLPKSLKLERVEPSPEHLWDKFFSKFINNRPNAPYVAKLSLSVRGPAGVSRGAFPLGITIGCGVYVDGVPHVTLYQGQSSDHIPDRNVGTVEPWDVTNLFADHVDWKSYQRVMFAGRGFNGNVPTFKDREVCFSDKHGSTVTVTQFSVELETHNLDDGITTYRVILSGAMKELLGFLDAVNRAPSYIFLEHSPSGASTVL
ncbi:het domain-containing protein [Colletotrichum incanum]|uniref:Het domain-containing protein n=1 Tax=Colletotrichum incanum TaxID=1573173 RepID=A0A166MSU2_COLIC|nr:het domain-containing protein [Colletotrichum incanum]OHW99612.1 HET domain containing protein [Colletotrichum incanum]